MDIRERLSDSPGNRSIMRHVAVGAGALVLLIIVWPFYSVPTGSRGVVTQFGKIVGIEGEGLAVLWPWQKLSNFSIRAEKAKFFMSMLMTCAP